jgi:hypothetical protein
MYAARDRSLRARLAAHSTAMRTKIAALIEAKAAEFGIPLPAPSEELAAAALALADGLALQQLATPSRTGGDSFFASMLARLLGIDTTTTSGAQRRQERSTR